MIPNLTWGADFVGLVTYLVVERDHEVIDLSGVSSIDTAANEMALIASQNSRASNKLLHLSLSAAHEDLELTGSTWLHVAQRIEDALGLAGHQRVIVRHKDTKHDHVHVFWCTISMDTFQTPQKRWFLKKGCAIRGIGPHAMTDEQCARVPPANRARRTYDFRALARAQDVCRRLERELQLRELDTPEQAKQKRLKRTQERATFGQQKRSERTGSVPLIERAWDIREALDHTDWPSRHRALAEIGLEIQPVFAKSRNGDDRLRGIVICDTRDPGNRIKASDLDRPHTKFGLMSLDKRNTHGAEAFEDWWPNRHAVSIHESKKQDDDRAILKRDYDLLAAKHRLDEQLRSAQLRSLRKQQRTELRAVRRSLMQQRKQMASELPVSHRRAFYAQFDRSFREPRLTPILSRHADEAREFRRTRKPTWKQYVDQRAQQGCRHAIALKRQSTRVELAPMLQKGQRLDVDVSYAISRGSRDQDRSRENFAPVIKADEEQEDKEAAAMWWKSQRERGGR
ncbi:MAG: relaxase/mobilization nuclease domain-containing protein [Sphingomonadaceae bacterium]